MIPYNLVLCFNNKEFYYDTNSAGMVEGSYCTMFGTGLVVSWIYLRFYQVSHRPFRTFLQTCPRNCTNFCSAVIHRIIHPAERIFLLISLFMQCSLWRFCHAVCQNVRAVGPGSGLYVSNPKPQKMRIQIKSLSSHLKWTFLFQIFKFLKVYYNPAKDSFK
jgi:hypothetical protein